MKEPVPTPWEYFPTALGLDSQRSETPPLLR